MAAKKLCEVDHEHISETLLKLTTCKDKFRGALCNNFLSQTPEVLK